MKKVRSSEFRQIARDHLKGHWGEAIRLNAFPALVNFISWAVTITMVLAVWAVFVLIATGQGDVVTKALDSGINTMSMPKETDSFFDAYTNQLSTFLMSIFIAMVSSGVLWTSLKHVNGKHDKMTFKDSLDGFSPNKIWGNFMLNLIMLMFKFLWLCLFIIPGIIKTLAYSQTMFIYYVEKQHNLNGEQIQYPWEYYITKSRLLMVGHKWQLFKLEFSFIGWYVLVVLTFGLAWFWVLPYLNMTRAVFNRYLLQLQLERYVEAAKQYETME